MGGIGTSRGTRCIVIRELEVVVGECEVGAENGARGEGIRLLNGGVVEACIKLSVY